MACDHRIWRPAIFQKNLLEVLKEGGSETLKSIDNPTDIEKIRAILSGPTQVLGKSETIKFIRSLLDDSQNDLEKFKVYIEQWYDDTMERVSTWYKRRLQIITFVIGFFIAAIFNVDTIAIVKKLADDPILREQMVAMAKDFVEDEEVKKIVAGIKDPKAVTDTSGTQIDTVKFNQLVKFTKTANDASSVLSIKLNQEKFCGIVYLSWSGFLGWLITAIALSLGSPFWFDILNKLVKLRTASQPAAEKEDKASAKGSSQSLPADKREG